MLDRTVLITSAALLVSAASTYVMQYQPGIGPEAAQRKLAGYEMPAISSLLVAGNLRSEGDDQSLHGWISGTRWRAMAPEARRTAAEELARGLTKAGIDSAELYDHSKLVLVIRDGELVSAKGLDR